MVSESKSKKKGSISIFLGLLSLILYTVVDFYRPEFINLTFKFTNALTQNMAFYVFAFPLKINIGAISLYIAGEKFPQIRSYFIAYIICIVLYIISIRLFYIKAITECLYYLINVPILEFHFLIALTLKNKVDEQSTNN